MVQRCNSSEVQDLEGDDIRNVSGDVSRMHYGDIGHGIAGTGCSYCRGRHAWQWQVWPLVSDWCLVLACEVLSHIATLYEHSISEAREQNSWHQLILRLHVSRWYPGLFFEPQIQSCIDHFNLDLSVHVTLTSTLQTDRLQWWIASIVW